MLNWKFKSKKEKVMHENNVNNMNQGISSKPNRTLTLIDHVRSQEQRLQDTMQRLEDLMNNGVKSNSISNPLSNFPPVIGGLSNSNNSQVNTKGIYGQMTAVNTKSPWGYSYPIAPDPYLLNKSDFERVLDQLFTLEEKWEYLQGLGYISRESGIYGHMVVFKLSSESTEELQCIDGNESLNRVFLREISIKFKNLLLSKATLKIKL
jgi:hypothetical protein